MRRRGAVALLAAFALSAALGLAAGRPRYIFINESSLRGHDLALKMSLKLAEKGSGIENALILLDHLPDHQSLEQTATRLFDQHRIGVDRQGRGILYLYSEKENAFKIEVSYALEGIFPDALCGRLEEGARTYMLSEIPQDFLSELIITMNLHGREKDAATMATTPSWLLTTYLSGGAGVSAAGYRPTLAEVQRAIRTVAPADVAAVEPTTDPETTLKRYLASLEAGLGDPRLPLLTEGSQIFRAVVPRNAAQQRRVFDYYRRALPYRLHVKDGLALAVFKPGVANLPVLLRRTATGAWLVDEPRAWTWFHRYEDSVNFFPKYDDVPFVIELQAVRFPTAFSPTYRQRVPTPPAPRLPFDLKREVEALEAQTAARPADAGAFARLGELYLFEMNWRSRAIAAFERAAALEPRNLAHHWRLYDLYINNSEMEKALSELRLLAQALPRDPELHTWLTFYTDAYKFAPGEF